MNNYNWDGDFPDTPKSFHDKLCSTLAQLPNKEEIIMSTKTSFRRTLVFTAIAVMVLATTAFAVGKIYITGSHSNSKDAFTQMPTSAQMEKVIEAAPKLVEKFNNGYAFKKGIVADSEDMDESGNVLYRYKSLDLNYTNGSKSVSLFMEKQKPGKDLPTDYPQATYKDITMYAYDYITKVVPLDYVKTEQDKLDEASGKVNFATMGGNTIETSTIQMLFWNDGDVSYSLMTMDNPLSSDELSDMAKQIIDQK